MHRVTLIAGAVCLAVLASTGAYTQVPPDPNNPLEAVPDTVTFTPYGEPISLENA
jgi:glc operon protein GlcG